ncbi:hypothetical protein [Duganella aquatilis]|uniref:hypothetical protein n=1 Tax=Duganella aquatilis TaxID=2666082 RepID=UPI0035311780
MAGAGGVLAGQLWKVSTLVLLAVLLAGGSAGGAMWWAAAAARDKALEDLAAEKGVNAELRAGIGDQNRAITQWYEASKDAAARGAAAQQQAAAAGLRYDQVLQQLAGAKATTCADAMPYVNQLLEKVR